MKAEVNKLENNKLVKVPVRLNNLFEKVDNLDIDKLKTVSLDLKNLSDVVNNEVVKDKRQHTKNKSK